MTKQKEISIKTMVQIGNQLIKAKQIAALGKIIGMKAKYFAEQKENIYTQDLDHVLATLKELESFIK